MQNICKPQRQVLFVTYHKKEVKATIMWYKKHTIAKHVGGHWDAKTVTECLQK